MPSRVVNPFEGAMGEKMAMAMPPFAKVLLIKKSLHAHLLRETNR